MNEEQVCAVQRRRSRQEVQQVVAEYESSGLSRMEFCRERGVALSTLGRYRSRQERQKAAGSNALLAVELSGRPPASVAAAGSNALLAVEVCGRAPAPIAANGSALAVVLRSGRRIEVGRGFDTGVLEQLVRVLEGV